MRTFLLYTCLFGSLFANSYRAFLPDAMHEATTMLKKHLTHTDHQVTIITPKLTHQKLSKAIAKTAQRDINITLITAGKSDDALWLVQYQQITYTRLQGLHTDHYHGSLQMTLWLFDSPWHCFSTLPMDLQEMSHSIGVLECSDDPLRYANYKVFATTLQQRSNRYLQY